MSGQGNRDLSGLKFSLNPSGYQFFTTTNTPLFMNVDKEYHGSGCFVAGLTRETPRFQAVASTLDTPSETDSWKLVDDPGQNNTDEAYNDVYNELLKVDNTNFIYHTTPDPYYLTETYAITDPEDIGNENTYKVKDALLQQSLSHRLIAFVGSKCLSGIVNSSFSDNDPRYASGMARKGLISTINDYYNDGCLQKVTHAEYGTRLFVILSSVAGTFYAYPVSAPRINETDFIQPLYVKESTPNYPNWVFTSNWLDHVNDTRRIPLEPCYSWSYNSTGTRAQAVVINRTTLSGTLFALDYNRTFIHVKPSSYIYETPTTLPLLVDAERIAFENEALAGQPIASDSFGWIELQLSIELIGPELKDFSFTVTIANSASPTTTAPVRVMAAYAKPLPWNNGIQVDDQIELFLTLRETTEQQKLRAGIDGIHGLEVPQVGVWTIKVNGTTKLEFPEHLLRNEKATDYQPISYCSLYYTMTCDQFVTSLIDLDLGALSFHRKIETHHAIVPENPDSYTVVNKRNAARVDTFVMGVLDGTVSAGNTSALALIDGYLDSLMDIQTATVVFSPNFTYKLRGRYVSSSSNDQAAMVPPIWWADVLWEPIIGIFLESYYAKTGSSSLGDKPAIVMAIDQINENNFVEEIMLPIFNYDSSETGYDHFDGAPVVPDPWPCGTMLSAANSDFIAADWTNTNFNNNKYAWLLYEIFKFFREKVAIYGNVLGDEYIPLRNIIALFNTNDYQIFNCVEPWLYFDIEYNPTYYWLNKSSRVEGIIKNYPWGSHWYNKIYGTGLSFTSKDGILQHPNGHYSYTHLLLPEYTGTMPFYETNFSSYDIPIQWSGRFNNATPSSMTTPLIESKFMDRICLKRQDGTFYETTHIDIYNEVFGQAENIIDYQLQNKYVVRSNTGEFYFGTNRVRNIVERHNNLYFILSHFADEVVPTITYNPYAHSRNAPFFTK